MRININRWKKHKITELAILPDSIRVELEKELDGVMFTARTFVEKPNTDICSFIMRGMQGSERGKKYAISCVSLYPSLAPLINMMTGICFGKREDGDIVATIMLDNGAVIRTTEGFYVSSSLLVEGAEA